MLNAADACTRGCPFIFNVPLRSQLASDDESALSTFNKEGLLFSEWQGGGRFLGTEAQPGKTNTPSTGPPSVKVIVCCAVYFFVLLGRFSFWETGKLEIQKMTLQQQQNQPHPPRPTPPHNLNNKRHTRCFLHPTLCIRTSYYHHHTTPHKKMKEATPRFNDQ
jgi:hypothetical protein